MFGLYSGHKDFHTPLPVRQLVIHVAYLFREIGNHNNRTAAEEDTCLLFKVHSGVQRP